ncbi:hypothetical protein [Acinetobacter nosocomialis]|uniref:hypothetical protein n=2 Tax=Acinetobacter TaxID=469 RepID=UPI000DE73B17|nr:hypothetical protein [Acinetobacter nosocomialis]SSR40343.1 Uncharacterised protein [Acinetobacter baumannii]MBR7692193.1 hypothetical protein [Acinetobacter nosocomialis]MBR7730670.1 hypothetical protein [Acinetobacter nosocomialis]MBS0036349.1 hypothetical protein [Acinetobacter nosocomialis]MDQ8804054.1 hypothetical protein [Acinetobacter nosocomialis]
MLFGDPSIFALKCIDTDSRQRKFMVNLVLIINGIEVGTLEDGTYIPTFKASLNRIVNPETLDLEKIKLSTEGKYDYFLNPNTTGKYMASLGDSFDDFDIFFYESESDFVEFIWRLHYQTVFSYHGLRSDIIYSGNVSISCLLNIIKEFLEWVNAVD